MALRLPSYEEFLGQGSNGVGGSVGGGRVSTPSPRSSSPRSSFQLPSYESFTSDAEGGGGPEDTQGFFSKAWDLAKRGYGAVERAPSIAASYYSPGGEQVLSEGLTPEPESISQLVQHGGLSEDQVKNATFGEAIGRRVGGTIAELGSSPTNAAILLATRGLGRLAGAGATARAALGAEGFLVPEAAAAASRAASIGRAAELGQRAVSAGFAGHMLPGAIEGVRGAAESYGREGWTPQTAADTIGALMDVGFTGLAAGHAVSPRAIPGLDKEIASREAGRARLLEAEDAARAAKVAGEQDALRGAPSQYEAGIGPMPPPAPLPRDFDLSTDFTPEAQFRAAEEPFSISNEPQPIPVPTPDWMTMGLRSPLPPPAPGLEGQFADIAGRPRPAEVQRVMDLGVEPPPAPGMEGFTAAEEPFALSSTPLEPPLAPPPVPLEVPRAEAHTAAPVVEGVSGVGEPPRPVDEVAGEVAAPAAPAAAGAAEVPRGEERRRTPLDVAQERRVDERRARVQVEHPGESPTAVQKIAEAQVQSETHPVTGLPSKLAMDSAEKAGTHGGWASGDLSGFKEINSELGHEGGNAALKAVAEEIQGVVDRFREEDPNGKAYSPGGDELGVGAASPEVAEKIGREIQVALSKGKFKYTDASGTIHERPLPKVDFGKGAKRFVESDQDLEALRKAAEDRGERKTRAQRELESIAGPEEGARLYAEARRIAAEKRAGAESDAEPGTAAAVPPAGAELRGVAQEPAAGREAASGARGEGGRNPPAEPGPSVPSAAAAAAPPVEEARAESPEESVLRAIREENPQAESNGALTYTPNVRNRAGLSPEAFDTAVRALEERGDIQVQHHPTPAQLTESERGGMVKRSLRDQYQRAVETGKITQAQADEALARAENVDEPRYGMALGLTEQARRKGVETEDAAPSATTPVETPPPEFDLLTAAEVSDPARLADQTGLAPRAIDRALEDIRQGRETQGAKEVSAALRATAEKERAETSAEIDRIAEGEGKPPKELFSWLDSQADPALDRLKKLRNTAYSGVDPSVAKDVAIVGVKKFKDWAMDAWDRAKTTFDDPNTPPDVVARYLRRVGDNVEWSSDKKAAMESLIAERAPSEIRDNVPPNANAPAYDEWFRQRFPGKPLSSDRIREYEKEMRGRKPSSTAYMGGADPAILKDLSVVGARWIRDGIRDFATFSSKLVREFGQGVAKLARSVWDSAMDLLRGGRPKVIGEEGARLGRAPQAPEAPAQGTGPRGSPAAGAEAHPPLGVASPKPAREPSVYSPRPGGGTIPIPPDVEARKAAEAFRSTTPPKADGKPSADISKGEVESDVNVARTSPEEWVQQAVGRMVDASPNQFGRGEAGARGPVRTWAEVRVEAVKQGFTEDEIKRAFKNKGGMLSDVELEGAKIASDELTKKARALYEESARLRKEGRTGAADDNAALYEGKVAELMSLQYAMIGAKAEAARTLAMARKLGTGLDPTERAFQRWLASNKAFSPEVQKEFYEAMKKGDPKALGELRRKYSSSTWLEKVVEFWKAGLLGGIPTQVVNFASNAGKITALEPVEAAVMGAMDFLKGRPDAERQAFTGEALAMWKGARSALGYALHGVENKGYAGLFPALKEIFKLQYEEAEGGRLLRRGEEGATEFEKIGGAIQGKKGELFRIPFHLLNAADAFWKEIAGSQELYRQAYREGRKQGLAGPKLEGHIRDFAAQYAEGTLKNVDEIRARVNNARVTGTYQETLGPFGRAIQQFERSNPLMSFILPFVKTPANIAKATLRRTPFGLVDAVVRKAAGKMTPEVFNERIAQGIVGTTLATAIFWAAKDGGLDFTGGGPTDPKKKQNLIDTGWQPYSVKWGDRYISYQRLEPLSSIVGMAADARELQDVKSWNDAVTKIGGLIGENLTNKTFLSGLEGFTSALHDPVQYGAAWVKQLEASVVPAIIGKAAQALDPTVRASEPFKTTYGIPEPIAARIPGLSQTLEAKKTPTGEERVRHTSAVERFLSPFPTTQEEQGPSADLQREFSRLEYIPEQPRQMMALSGGAKIDLTPEEYKILEASNLEATKRAARMIKSSFYKSQTPDDQVDMLRRIYTDSRKIARSRLYRDTRFAQRAAKTQRQFHADMQAQRGGGGEGA